MVRRAEVLDPTKVAPQAYDIVHPQAEAYQVASVMVETIESGPPDNGIYTVKIKCAEWFPKQRAPRSQDHDSYRCGWRGEHSGRRAMPSWPNKPPPSTRRGGGQFGPPPFPSTSENKP